MSNLAELKVSWHYYSVFKLGHWIQKDALAIVLTFRSLRGRYFARKKHTVPVCSFPRHERRVVCLIRVKFRKHFKITGGGLTEIQLYNFSISDMNIARVFDVWPDFFLYFIHELLMTRET